MKLSWQGNFCDSHPNRQSCDSHSNRRTAVTISLNMGTFVTVIPVMKFCDSLSNMGNFCPWSQRTASKTLLQGRCTPRHIVETTISTTLSDEVTWSQSAMNVACRGATTLSLCSRTTYSPEKSVGRLFAMDVHGNHNQYMTAIHNTLTAV